MSKHRGKAQAQKSDKSIWRTIRDGLSLGIFAIVLAILVVAVIIPKVTGSTPLTVLTSSMEPNLPPGTLLVVQPVDVASIEVGDIITYQIESGQPAVVTHRVVEVTSSTVDGLTFLLKGDNNDAVDPIVIPAQIQGRLFYSIPLVGHASTLLNGEYRALIIPIAAGAMLIYAVIAITMGLFGANKKRRAKKREAAAVEAAEREATDLEAAQRDEAAQISSQP
jgi:signal peptidase